MSVTVAASGKISLLQPFPKQTFPVFREISQAYGGDCVVGHLVGGHRHADIVVRESVQPVSVFRMFPKHWALRPHIFRIESAAFLFR